jgi:molybdopterin synthase catalytic subunit
LGVAEVFELRDAVIDPREVEAAVAWPGAGAILTFSGVTRDNDGGERVLGLSYEAYPKMAVAEMAKIGAEVAERWPGARCAMLHRIGEVPIGEASVIISVATPHRPEAYAASRFAIDTLKARVPVWKKEHLEGGERWKANAEFQGEGGE